MANQQEWNLNGELKAIENWLVASLLRIVKIDNTDVRVDIVGQSVKRECPNHPMGKASPALRVHQAQYILVVSPREIAIDMLNKKRLANLLITQP